MVGINFNSDWVIYFIGDNILKNCIFIYLKSFDLSMPVDYKPKGKKWKSDYVMLAIFKP